MRGARPLAEVTSSVRMRLEAEVHEVAALAVLADLLQPGRAGQGEVLVRLPGVDGEPQLRLGGDFALDGELVERLTLVDGLTQVVLAPVRGSGHLRLVT